VFDLFRVSFINLGRKKSRSMLTVLGIAIGVASVVIIASIGEIGAYSVNQELDSMGVSGLMISGNRKLPGTAMGEEHLALIRDSGAVDSAIPIILDYTKTYMRSLMMDAAIWGIDYGANQVFALNVLHGRLITKNDVSAGRQICLVDQNVAQAYYKRDNIVGKTLTLQFASGRAELEIVGVVSSGGNLAQSLVGNVIPSFVYTPYTTLRELSGKDSFDQIAVRLRPGVDGDIAGSQIKTELENEFGVAGGFKSDNMISQKEKLGGVMGTVTTVLSAIAGVSLVVAGLSIMTVMLVSVHERTREIGIKKSIGASRRIILTEFLIEAFAISVIGSAAGAAGGVVAVIIGCLIMGLPIRLSISTIGFAIAFSMVMGVVFGVYPASVASKLKPVDALRYDI
jgi:putative ABC transport system permease protein